MSGPQNITRLINDWQQGSDAALDELTPLVYDQLKRLAQHQMRDEKRSHTLQATALVNEAFLRLGDVHVEFENQAHFIALSATLMRRVLVDHARRKSTAKRGGGDRNLTLDEDVISAEHTSGSILDLDNALEELAKYDASMVRTVELIYFGGLNYDEAATTLGVSRSKFADDLRLAKAWLKVRLAHD